MASYRIEFKRSAEWDIRRISPTPVPGILARAAGLAQEPFPRQALKLSGEERLLNVGLSLALGRDFGYSRPPVARAIPVTPPSIARAIPVTPEGVPERRLPGPPAPGGLEADIELFNQQAYIQQERQVREGLLQ